MSDEVISINEAIGELERKIQQLGEEKTRYAQNHPARVELESQIQIYRGVIRELHNKKAAIQSKAIQTERWGEVRLLCAQGEYAEAMALVGSEQVVDGRHIRMIRSHADEMRQYVRDQAGQRKGAYELSADFGVLRGQIFDEVVKDGDTAILFIRDGYAIYSMEHEQDCCEQVIIEDVCGDLEDLVGVPILSCEEYYQDGAHDDGVLTYTFYKFRTQKGDVTIRWLGESNGYYSHAVSLVEKPKERWP